MNCKAVFKAAVTLQNARTNWAGRTWCRNALGLLDASAKMFPWEEGRNEAEGKQAAKVEAVNHVKQAPHGIQKQPPDPMSKRY